MKRQGSQIHSLSRQLVHTGNLIENLLLKSSCCSMSTNHLRCQWICTGAVCTEKQSQSKAGFMPCAARTVFLFFHNLLNSITNICKKTFTFTREHILTNWFLYIIIISHLKYLKTCYGTHFRRHSDSQGRNDLIHFLLHSTMAFSLPQIWFYVRPLWTKWYRKYTTAVGDQPSENLTSCSFDQKDQARYLRTGKWISSREKNPYTFTYIYIDGR